METNEIMANETEIMDTAVEFIETNSVNKLAVAGTVGGIGLATVGVIALWKKVVKPKWDAYKAKKEDERDDEDQTPKGYVKVEVIDPDKK